MAENTTQRVVPTVTMAANPNPIDVNVVPTTANAIENVATKAVPTGNVPVTEAVATTVLIETSGIESEGSQPSQNLFQTILNFIIDNKLYFIIGASVLVLIIIIAILMKKKSSTHAPGYYVADEEDLEDNYERLRSASQKNRKDRQDLADELSREFDD